MANFRSIRHNSPARWVEIACIGVLFSVFGCASGPEVRRPARLPLQPSVGSSTIAPPDPTVSLTTPPSDLLAAILDRVDKDVFVSASVGAPPSNADAQGLWFYATVRAPGNTYRDDLSAVWEADLVQGAVAANLASGQADLDAVFAGSSISVQGPSGAVVSVPSGQGDAPAGQVFAGRGSDADAIAFTRDTLSKFGLDVVVIRILHPLDSALYVEAASGAPTEGQQVDVSELTAALDGDPRVYEGLYLQIDGPNGEPIFCGATDERTGAGRQWIPNELDGKIGYVHG